MPAITFAAMSVSDTTRDAHDVYRAKYESLSGSERVDRAIEMSEDAKAIAIAGIRFRNPDMTEPDVHAEWLRLLYGDELSAQLSPDAC